jgi:hypothetical protein
LDSANQALSELEEATGKPVLIVEAPELKVLATIRRAGPEDSSHVLRIQGGENRAADYLIVLTGHRYRVSNPLLPTLRLRGSVLPYWCG